MAGSRGSLLNRAVRRVLHPGTSVIRQGDFVTFKPQGFVAAENPAELMFRHYYELKHLRDSLSLMPELGVEPGRSLEVGCGFGRLSPYIAEHFQQHTAVDINQWAMSEATRFYPQVSFASASATELPFPERSFDAVITWTVLQHVPNALIGKALNEIKRVAKPKSLLILCEATLNAATPQRDEEHTHDRFPEFYADAFSGRKLLVSEFIGEIDRVPSMCSPGRIMVFGPSNEV